MAHGICRWIPHLLRARGGVSTIEFCCIGLLTVTTVLAAYDLGNAAHEQIRLQEAVRLAGAYASRWPTDVAGIRAAVTAALPSGWTLTDPGGVAAIACSCVDPGSGTPTPLAGCTTSAFDTCTGGGGLLISISASKAYTAVDPMFATAISRLSATYVTRFQ